MNIESIQANHYKVHFNNAGFEFLNSLLQTNSYSKVFILTDSNTNECCLPLFLSEIEGEYPFEILEIEAGEIHKNIETCMQVWLAMSDLGADRKSILLHLGGGVVTDLGGFIASTYQRGIDFVNIPTSLLAMVDASVGGKTGVDLGTLKNQIGVINNPLGVIIDSRFLSTLPGEQLRSGMAEMFKHGLIQSESYWQKMKNLRNLNLTDLDGLIHESVVIKNNIVMQDPTEKGLRKTLNFGHTLGHAIESYCLSNPQKKDLLHGEAIAIGMILAGYLSHKTCQFPIENVADIKSVFGEYFPKVSFDNTDIDQIIELLKYDKKNSHGNINFLLLSAIGKPVFDQKIDNKLIREAFAYYAQS